MLRDAGAFLRTDLAHRIDFDRLDQLRELLDLAFVAKLFEQLARRLLEPLSNEHLADGTGFFFDRPTNGGGTPAPPDDGEGLSLGNWLGDDLTVFDPIGRGEEGGIGLHAHLARRAIGSK